MTIDAGVAVSHVQLAKKAAFHVARHLLFIAFDKREKPAHQTPNQALESPAEVPADNTASETFAAPEFNVPM